jgi:hypothetical protein
VVHRARAGDIVLGQSQLFWANPESFYRMLEDSGYPVILAAEPWYLPDRTFFVALP